VATIIVIGSSVGAAVFTYIGMSDPTHLPDGLAVLTALAALLVPLAITYLSRMFAGNERHLEYGPTDDYRT
jgi:hypothetical protein